MTRLIVKGEVVYSTSTEEGNLRITNGILGTDNWLRVSTPGDARMVVSIPNARRLLIATPPNYKHLVEQIEELTGLTIMSIALFDATGQLFPKYAGSISPAQ